MIKRSVFALVLLGGCLAFATTASAQSHSEGSGAWWDGKSVTEFMKACSDDGMESANWGDTVECFYPDGRVVCRISGGRTQHCVDTRATEKPGAQPSSPRQPQQNNSNGPTDASRGPGPRRR